MAAAFDWKGVEQAAVDQVVAAVRAVRASHPEERIYGAMFHEFYGDGERLYWPSLTVGTEETLAATVARYGDSDDDVHGLRWSGPDLVHTCEPGEIEDAWASRCADVASAARKFAGWGKVYHRFERCFPKAAKKARAQLIREGIVGRDFIAVAMDEAGDLVPLSLTPAQLSRHFPEYDEAEQERRRIAALPIADQVREVVALAVRAAPYGPLTQESDAMARALGAAAVPALVEVVSGREPGEPFLAIMLLAEINDASPDAVAACLAAMLDTSAEVSVRAWAASALARFDRMDLIEEHLDDLPAEVVGRGLADPFGSFRDRGNHRRLDYRPLEAVLSRHPEIADIVANELEPGCGFCAISADEVPAAQAALDSRWAFLREHARLVLEDHER